MSQPFKNNRHHLPMIAPSLASSGKKKHLRPKRAEGTWWQRRRIVAIGLILGFFIAPNIKIGGEPALMFDVIRRKFYIFGGTFNATDGSLLMLLMLAIFVGIFWLSASWGRVWCGWGCPQTVYLEFLFRPIEQWIEGGRAAQAKIDKNGVNWRRLLKFAVYLALSFRLANQFLAYFVGVARLRIWIFDAPAEHPAAFIIVGFTTAIIFFDFAYFREQMCTVACPYARLQSVLLDENSLSVYYDHKRGEERGRGEDKGDCVDCGACVTACPTGIDIRDGLQLECVACTQCIDACDAIMDRFDRPRGLIRYESEVGISGEPKKRFRLRPLIYPVLFFTLIAALFLMTRSRSHSQLTVMRSRDPFALDGDIVRNSLRLKVSNRSADKQEFRFELKGAKVDMIIAQSPFTVDSEEQAESIALVQVPAALIPCGILDVQICMQSDVETELCMPYRLLGPKSKDCKN